MIPRADPGIQNWGYGMSGGLGDGSLPVGSKGEHDNKVTEAETFFAHTYSAF